MGRWEPGASGRLREAALALYIERGFEATTVSDIAERAGVTARTFFRHFADKREVLFAGSAELAAAIVHALEAAPAGAPPMVAVATALDAAAALLGRNHEHSRRRQLVIDAHPDLQERELIKMDSLASALAAGLRRRGVPDRDAALAAQVGVVVLRVAFEGWVTADTGTDLAEAMRATLTRLGTVTGAGRPAPADRVG